MTVSKKLVTPDIAMYMLAFSTLYFPKVDLGREMELHAVANQGYTSSGYYITSYTIKYSVDGNSFYDVSNGTSTMVNIYTSFNQVKTAFLL